MVQCAFSHDIPPLNNYFAPLGVVWCGIVWCVVVWCGIVWCVVVCGVLWCGVVCCVVVWYGVMVWCVVCYESRFATTKPALFDMVYEFGVQLHSL